MLSEATKAEKLMLVDVVGESNYKSYKKTDVGFCTENAREDAYVKAQIVGSSIINKQLITFRLDYSRILIAILKKMILTCPLSYSLVRNMVALDPREMTANLIYPRREIQKDPNHASQFK